MPFELGRDYDSLPIGDRASFSKTISESDVYLFAGISGVFFRRCRRLPFALLASLR
jgi:hypothetical protein